MFDLRDSVSGQFIKSRLVFKLLSESSKILERSGMLALILDAAAIVGSSFLSSFLSILLLGPAVLDFRDLAPNFTGCPSPFDSEGCCLERPAFLPFFTPANRELFSSLRAAQSRCSVRISSERASSVSFESFEILCRFSNNHL